MCATLLNLNMLHYGNLTPSARSNFANIFFFFFTNGGKLNGVQCQLSNSYTICILIYKDTQLCQTRATHCNNDNSLFENFRIHYYFGRKKKIQG